MVRIVYLLLIFIIGCAPQYDEFYRWAKSDQLKVLCTTEMIGDLAREVGREYVNVIVLIQGELDPHSYEIMKGDDEKLALADLIFYNGLGLEHGASLHYYLHHESKAKSIGDEIQKRYPERILFDQGAIDPHIWMDISLWEKGVDFIEQELIQKLPQYKKELTQNAQNLRRKMEKTHRQVYQTVQKIPEKRRYVVTSHDAFNYFARGYLNSRPKNDWKKRFLAPEGLAPDGQISFTDIHRMLNYIQRHQIETLFPESNVSQDSILKIASTLKKKGYQVTISPDVLYGDAMGPSYPDRKANYFDMMLYNAKTLKENLQ